MARRMPAEWEPQEAVWLSWPVSPAIWPGELPLIQQTFARLAATLSRFVDVRISCAREHHNVQRRKIDALEGVVRDRIAFVDIPTNDVWVRDHGPVWVVEDGKACVTDWVFNGWGGKFTPWDLDDAVPERLAEHLGVGYERSELVLEGGGIETNGAGLFLTTAPVLLNPNRWTTGVDDRREVQQRYEAEMRRLLGAERVVWLPHGLAHDDTDGHIDNLTRFVAEDVLVTVSAPEKDENYRRLRENREVLEDLRLEIIDLPLPDEPVTAGGKTSRDEVLCASYANFLLTNGAVVVPQFAQHRSDDRACGILRELFPEREVIGLDARDVLREGGAWHCCTNNQPDPTSRPE